MDRIVPISEARQQLASLLDEARDHEIYLLKHGRPVGVLVSAEAFEALRTRIEDLEDELSVLRAGDPIPFVRSKAPASAPPL